MPNNPIRRPLWKARLAALLMGLTAAGLPAEEALFARLETEPARIYAGQPFSLLLSVFTTGQDLEPGMQIGGLPDGLQLQPFQEMPVLPLTINGTAYQALRNRCEAVCPQPGELRFEPVIHAVTVRSVQSFFFTQKIRHAVRIPIQPFTLTVHAVPLEKAPPGYDGLIGTFRLEGSVSTNRILPGDLVTLTYRLSGAGRWDRVPTLGHSAIPGFKVYPPRLQQQQAATSRSFSQVVIPEHAETLTIPPLTLAAFNPARDAFDVLSTGPFTLEPDSDRPTNSPPSLLLPLPDTESDGVPPPLTLHDSPAAWAGQPGKAMLHLLRAIRENPRDAISRSHVNRLLQTSLIAGAPDLSLWSRLSRREWGWLALVALGLAGLGVFSGRRQTRRRAAARNLAAVFLVLGITALGGMAWWTAGPPATERVVVVPGVQGRLAPAETALPTARLPEGTVVRQCGEQGAWRRVWTGGTALWLPAAALERP